MTSDLRTYKHPQQGQDNPEHLVILLHGLGSNGQDLIGLAPYWASALPKALFVSPDAPFPCDMAPFGYQWFSLQDRDPAKILAGIQKATPILHDYIAAQQEKFGVPADKTVLVGFSQGTMMSLYAGPRYRGADGKGLAGILGYSGALFVSEAEEDLVKMPVHLVHGERDDVVPFAAYKEAMKGLKENSFSVSGISRPALGHSIDEEGIESGAAFLQSVLS